MRYVRPDSAKIEAIYTRLERDLIDTYPNDALEPVHALIREWNALVSFIRTADHLLDVRYHQNTMDEALKQERRVLDDLAPLFLEWDVQFAKRLLAHPKRKRLEAVWGEQLFAILEVRVRAFSKEMAEGLRKESETVRAYTDLLAQATVDWEGRSLPLSQLGPYLESADRSVREAACRVKWAWFLNVQETLDTLYDTLVKTRHALAQTLGYDTFTPLGYALMTRTDYSPEDVVRFREAILSDVVPLASRLRDEQRKNLGLAELSYCDELLFHVLGNPTPKGNTAWIVEQAQTMFDEMSPELSQFFTLMQTRGLLDLDSRVGKAGGGFCTDFPDDRVPFIFANFNGTADDVSTLIHECGHAFQAYMSRDQDLVDYRFPTLEACEIHSMSLELLTAPYMSRFFGDADARRYTDVQLKEAILFLPYAAAIDHFQHDVYAHPEWSPSARRARWRALESLYLPWRRYDHLPHLEAGGLWQGQAHVYSSPFYYIDYALAQTCALQLALLARRDRGEAMRRYVAICRPGGSKPFLSLLAVGDLQSPFDARCLKDVVDELSVQWNL